MPQVIAIPVVAALTSLGASAAVAGAIGSAVGALAFSAAVGLAGQALLGSATPGGASVGRAASNSPEVRGSVKQAVPVQRIIFGTTRFGGAFYFYKVVPPYLYVGHIHSAFPVTSFDRLFIGEIEVPLDADGEPVSAPYLTASLTPRLVTDSQSGLLLAQLINPILDADFAALDADFRLPGLAETVYRFDYGADFDEFQALWGQVQIPDAQWIGQGTPVPDPRNPAHILAFDPTDPTELYAALASWDYSANASLIQAFWAAMPFGLNAGPAAIYQGAAGDALKASADFDDEPVPLAAGGVQRRHEINGVVSLDQNPLKVMEDMLTANRGFISPRAGSVTITSSQPRSPSMTITDDMILGGFSYRDRQPRRDLVNQVHARFVSSERNYQDADAPSWRRADLIAADGEDLEITLGLPFTATHQHAQRLEKIALDEARLGRSIAGTFSLDVLGLVEGLTCTVWSRLYPAINGTYEVVQWSLTEDLTGVALALAEYDPAIARAWDAATDEQDFTIEIEEI